MWTPTTRRQHSRKGLRYETDLTDAEWALIEPHLSAPSRRVHPRAWPLREIVNAIFYVPHLHELRRFARSLPSIPHPHAPACYPDFTNWTRFLRFSGCLIATSA
ncbi:MAG TPA: transposase [Casimicrobiaceae bacterium]|nr:transposase [Casimicrobiaceae bacterium]